MSAVCECFSYQRTAKGQCAMVLGGELDNFLKAVFKHPMLAVCHKLAALHVNNKISLGLDKNILNSLPSRVGKTQLSGCF